MAKKYLEEEAVVAPVKKILSEYAVVISGCGPSFEGGCLNARSGPGEDYPVIAKLRKGMVLKIGERVESGGRAWYKIVFDEKLRYPERLKTDWYVAADYVSITLEEDSQNLQGKIGDISVKRIIVDLSDQILYAYEGGELFMKEHVSTGIELTPTPRGNFIIFRKTPSRYMQGPIPGISEKEFDLPGVPWNLYFTAQGAVIHGAYWHEDFGKTHSNGCVNLSPLKAQELYTWADIGMRVVVRD